MVEKIRSGVAYPANESITHKNRFTSLQQVVREIRPTRPLYVIYPEIIEAAARQFVAAFPGKTLYAIKTNPEVEALDAISQGGVKAYDVASLEEVIRIKSRFPKAEIFFMHPVKSPEDIRSAYFDYGVRNFVLDCKEELFKILRETDLAQDLSLFIRLALPKNDKAMIDFSSKFGASRGEAVTLLRETRNVAASLSLSFHVGTQTTDASKYASAIAYAAELVRESGVRIDSLNVGGGFPVAYAGDEGICTLRDCVDEIKAAMADAGWKDMPLLAEPGRILVAQGASLVTRVELRKGNTLYINDGIYGGLFDACAWLGLRYPVKAISCDRAFDGEMQDYRLAGPTCDSLDMMDGPFTLPHDIGIGDWIAVENTGAYSVAMRSNFNGFGACDTVCVYPDKAFRL